MSLSLRLARRWHLSPGPFFLRSRQVNEVTTKTLRAIVTQVGGQSRNVESIAVYMAKMEARLVKIDQALAKVSQETSPAQA